MPGVGRVLWLLWGRLFRVAVSIWLCPRLTRALIPHGHPTLPASSGPDHLPRPHLQMPSPWGLGFSSGSRRHLATPPSAANLPPQELRAQHWAPQTLSLLIHETGPFRPLGLGPTPPKSTAFLPFPHCTLSLLPSSPGVLSFPHGTRGTLTLPISRAWRDQ